MLEPEERRKNLIEGFKKDIVKLQEACQSLKYYCKEVKKLDLHHVYDRKDLRTLDILSDHFARLYRIITDEFFIVITILEDYKVHWTHKDRFFFQDMLELKLIDDIETFEKIKKLKRSIRGEFIIYDQVKLYEDIFSYAEILYETADRVEKFVKERYKA